MQREKQRRRPTRSERNWKKDSERIRWSVSRFFLFVSPHVAILSLQQRLSVAPCVAQWLINMCPSRRITLASENLQTHQHTFWTAETSFLPPLYHPSHPLPSIPFWWLMVCAELWALQYFHDVSQTHLGLNILFTSSQHSENHNNTELRQKFRTHYSLFRSRPRLKSSPSL